MEEIQKLIGVAQQILNLDDQTSCSHSLLAIAKMMALQMESSGTCKYCFSPRAGHCGGQYWCYKNYHSENPTKFEVGSQVLEKGEECDHLYTKDL